MYGWMIGLVVVVILLLIFTTMAFYYHRKLDQCVTNPSPWCYTDWTCPPKAGDQGNSNPYQDMMATIATCSNPSNSALGSGACPFAF